MNKLVLALVCTLSLNSFSQTHINRISKRTAGLVTCVNEEKIDIQTQDTNFLITLSFQNTSYQYIIDSKFIFINSEDGIKDLIEKLGFAIEWVDYRKADWRCSFNTTSISVYAGRSKVYLSSGGGQTWMKKTHVLKLITWLEEQLDNI